MRALLGLICTVEKTGLVELAHVEHHADDGKEENAKEEQQGMICSRETMTYMIDLITTYKLGPKQAM